MLLYNCQEGNRKAITQTGERRVKEDADRIQ